MQCLECPRCVFAMYYPQCEQTTKQENTVQANWDKLGPQQAVRASTPPLNAFLKQNLMRKSFKVSQDLNRKLSPRGFETAKCRKEALKEMEKVFSEVDSELWRTVMTLMFDHPWQIFDKYSIPEAWYNLFQAWIRRSQSISFQKLFQLLIAYCLLLILILFYCFILRQKYLTILSDKKVTEVSTLDASH